MLVTPLHNVGKWQEKEEGESKERPRMYNRYDRSHFGTMYIGQKSGRIKDTTWFRKEAKLEAKE